MKQKNKKKRGGPCASGPCGPAWPASRPSPPGVGSSSTPRQAGWELRGGHATAASHLLLSPGPTPLAVVRHGGSPFAVSFFPFLPCTLSPVFATAQSHRRTPPWKLAAGELQSPRHLVQCVQR